MGIRTDNPAHPANSNQLISVGARSVERIWAPEEPLLETTQEQLIDACKSHFREVCGLISVRQEIYWIENVHEEPKRNFFFDKSEYELAVTQIYEDNDGHDSAILGIFHSHPSDIPWPSTRDIVGWPDPSLAWRYWVVTNQAVLEWSLL